MNGTTHSRVLSYDDILAKIDNPQKLNQMQEDELYRIVDDLERVRFRDENIGNYDEALLILEKIKEIEQYIDKFKLKSMKEKHIDEKFKIEEDFKAEETDFNEFWDKKMSEYEEESKKILQQLLDRHKNDFEELKQDLEDSYPNAPRDTPMILELKKTLSRLVRAQDYKEASNIKKQLYELQKKELEKHTKAREIKLKQCVENFMKKQEIELNALKKKIQTGGQELLTARNKEHEKLFNRFRGVRNSVEVNQFHEFYKFEKGLKGKRNDILNKSTFADYRKQTQSKSPIRNNLKSSTARFKNNKYEAFF